MKKYLVDIRKNIADEDDAVLIAVVDENTLNDLRKTDVYISMFQIDCYDPYKFDDVARVSELSEKELLMLDKLGLAYVKTGSFSFCNEENDEEAWI